MEQYAGVKQEKKFLYRLMCNTLCNSFNSKQMPLERGEFFDKGHIRKVKTGLEEPIGRLLQPGIRGSGLSSNSVSKGRPGRQQGHGLWRDMASLRSPHRERGRQLMSWLYSGPHLTPTGWSQIEGVWVGRAPCEVVQVVQRAA